MLRWIGKYLKTFLLAFVLALFVWVSAILATDPNEENIYPRPIPIKIVGLAQDMLVVESGELETELTLIAPRSIWNRLQVNSDLLSAWIDLSDYGAGEHLVPVQTQVRLAPARVVNVEPADVRVVLEPLAMATFAVKLEVVGEPALGYRECTPRIEPARVTVSGPQSRVSQVKELRAVLDITGADDTIKKEVSLRAYDDAGNQVTGVALLPTAVSVEQPITLLGGYRNVVVKVVTMGQVADGYWLTNVSVTPPNVTVFSADPQLVISLPGYVETNPLDLTGLSDDIDIRATLNLPQGVSLAGEESVLVRLSIAALEGSLPISLPIDVVGLSPEYAAVVSPEMVDLLLIGPLPILNNLNPAGIRVSVNVAGLEPGVYQLAPVVDLLPNQIQVSSIMPEVVEVIVELAPTPTATPHSTQVFGVTPTPVRTPTP